MNSYHEVSNIRARLYRRSEMAFFAMVRMSEKCSPNSGKIVQLAVKYASLRFKILDNYRKEMEASIYPIK